MKVVNLTTHDVNVKKEDGTVITYSYSGHIARAFSKYEQYGEINEGVIMEREIEPVMEFGIDNIEPYTLYIVSYQFAMKLKQINYPNIHQFVYPCSTKADREYGTKDIITVPSLIAIL